MTDSRLTEEKLRKKELARLARELSTQRDRDKVLAQPRALHRRSFRDFRETEEFRKTFESIFGEPFNVIDEPSQMTEAPTDAVR